MANTIALSTNKIQEASIIEAKERCLCIEDHITSIRCRVNKWENWLESEKRIRDYYEIKGKMNRWITEALKACDLTEKRNARTTINEHDKAIFSQSDVGKHNLIYMCKDVYMVDLEYAGYDGLSKHIADWYLQPDHGMNIDQTVYYINELKKNGIWQNRISKILLEIVEINRYKWAFIIMNQILTKGTACTIEKAEEYLKSRVSAIDNLHQTMMDFELLI